MYFLEPILLFIIFSIFTNLVSPNYDTIKLTNILVRGSHGIGCIYYIVPIIHMNNYSISIIEYDNDYNDILYIINRSISYFLWDIFALLIEEEKEKKTYIGHHILTILGIYSGSICLDNCYNIIVGLIIGEITNPIHQTIDILKVIRYRVISIELLYLLSFTLIRGIIGSYALITIGSNVRKLNTINLSCMYSYFINIMIYILLIPLSFNWSYRQYNSITKYLKNRYKYPLK